MVEAEDKEDKEEEEKEEDEEDELKTCLSPCEYLRVGECRNFLFLFYFWDGISLCRPDWSAMAWSWLTAASASQVQVILLPQLPE